MFAQWAIAIISNIFYCESILTKFKSKEVYTVTQNIAAKIIEINRT